MTLIYASSVARYRDKVTWGEKNTANLYNCTQTKLSQTKDAKKGPNF